MEQTTLEFKPDRFRQFSNSFLQWAAGLLIVFSIVILIMALLGGKMHLDTLLISQLVMLLSGAVGIAIGVAMNRENTTIVISSEDVSGPSPMSGKKVHFPLHTLDREKSSKQNIFLKLMGGRYLVSTTGLKILFVERIFDKNQVAEILNALGFI